MKEVNSHDELLKSIENTEKAYLLLYKKGSDQSDCAYANLSEAEKEYGEVKVFTADTNLVRDIHHNYNVTSAPSMIVFEKGKFRNIFKGCHHPGFFQSIFESAVVTTASADKPQKSLCVKQKPHGRYSLKFSRGSSKSSDILISPLALPNFV